VQDRSRQLICFSHATNNAWNSVLIRVHPDMIHVGHADATRAHNKWIFSSQDIGTSAGSGTEMQDGSAGKMAFLS
jgi:hypothetical protein